LRCVYDYNNILHCVAECHCSCLLCSQLAYSIKYWIWFTSSNAAAILFSAFKRNLTFYKLSRK